MARAVRRRGPARGGGIRPHRPRPAREHPLNAFARLLFLFLTVPIVDLALLVFVGRHVGLLPTILTVIATALAGAHFCRREGLKTLQALKSGLFEGRVLPQQLADAVLILVGGALLLTPGFLTDLAGLAMVLPFTRPAARRILIRLVPLRIEAVNFEMFQAFGAPNEEIRDVDARIRDVEPDDRPKG